MKNLVMIHLESVSKLIYQMNQDVFPNVRKFQASCLQYSNYYATATSTAMVLSDITYGDLYRLENTQLFGDFKVTHKNAESFVDRLADIGYHTLGIHYPAALGNEINPGHMYAQKTDLVNYSDYNKAISDVKMTISNAVENDSNFLIYFCNEVSHLCYQDSKKFQIKNPTKRWKHGYEVIDKTVGDLIGYLEEKKLLDNTVVVLYGDHGDDFYCHDYNGGFAHSIEPYANIIRTPFMIYDKSIGNGMVDDIVCSVDIKQIVYNLVGCNLCENNPYIYDKYRSGRKYVFSRNLFAGQVPKKINGYISNVRKAYGITTEEYSLVLTDEGYRMYIQNMDPTCNNNVLDYFYLSGKKIRHIGGIDYLCVHYKSYMGHGTIGELQRNFVKMAKWMRLEVSKLEKETRLPEVVSHEGYCKIFYSKNMFYMFSKLKAKSIIKKAKALMKKVQEKMNG